jgi:hypothetical protein
MAQIPQDDNLLNGLNTNISFNNPAQTAQMQMQSLSPIAKLGNELINKGVEIYSKDQQQKAITQAYKDAAQGKFSTVAGITGANEAYNNIMNNIAPAIMASKAGNQLDALYNTIKLDPNFNPATATQQYAKGAKGIIDAYTHDNVPEQWKSQVSLTMQKQAMQYGVQMNNDALNRTLNVQNMEALQAKDALMSQITKAASLGNDGLANDLLGEYKTIVMQGVFANKWSPFQANTMQKNAEDEIKLQSALIKGTAITNDPALESKRLAIYGQQQRAIEQSQAQNHFDFNNFLLNKVSGNPVDAPIQMTDEQVMLSQQADTANSYFNRAKAMDPEQQSKLLIDPNFLSLSSPMRQMVQNNLATFTKSKQTNDFRILGLDENTPFSVRLSDGIKYGMTPDQLITPQEKAKIELQFIQNPTAAYDNLIKITTPQFAEYYTKKLAFKADKPNPALLIPSAKQDSDYMSGLSIDGSMPNFTAKAAPDMWKALNNQEIPAMMNLAIVNRIGVGLKANPLMDYDTAFKNRYTNDNGILEKGDEKIRYPNNAMAIAKKLSTNNADINKIANTIEDGTVYPDYKNNQYIFRKGSFEAKVAFDEIGSLSNEPSGIFSKVTIKGIKAAGINAFKATNPILTNVVEGITNE